MARARQVHHSSFSAVSESALFTISYTPYLKNMSHIHTLNKDEITVHGSSSSRDNSQANTESSLEASKDDRVEIDTDKLKDHLGLKDIVSSVEEIKALFHEVMGKRTLKASEPNTSKKARTEDASVPRADNSPRVRSDRHSGA